MTQPLFKHVVIDGYLSGTPIAEIARITGRSMNSVRATARQLGLVHPSDFRVLDEVDAANSSPQFTAWRRAKAGASQALRAFHTGDAHG